MKIGKSKQLFIDKKFMEKSEGIDLSMNLPVQHPDPVVIEDRPWEGKGVSDYNTVFQEKDGSYRMWYGAAMYVGLPQEGAIRLCYAESNDGIHWEKPSLGLVTFQGSKDNNIVAPKLEKQSMQGACVFRDEKAPDEERYKLWSKFRPTDEEMKNGALQGLWAMHSPDGIHWTEYPDQPNPKGQKCDTQNMFFFDDRINQYVGYHESPKLKASTRRRKPRERRVTVPWDVSHHLISAPGARPGSYSKPMRRSCPCRFRTSGKQTCRPWTSTRAAP